MGRRCEIDVRRADGTTEIVVKDGWVMTPALWPQVQAATRNAGRGECLAYRNVTDAMTDAQREAAEIVAIEREADRCQDADYSRSLQLRAKAEAARQAWAAKYPAEAAAAEESQRTAAAGRARDVANYGGKCGGEWQD